MSDHDRGDGREHSHDYAVVARPYVRIGIRADTGEDGLEALSVAIDYDENGVDVPERTTESAVDRTGDDRRRIGQRDLDVEVYREDRRAFSTDGGLDLDTSQVLGYVNDIAIALGRLSRRLR